MGSSRDCLWSLPSKAVHRVLKTTRCTEGRWTTPGLDKWGVVIPSNASKGRTLLFMLSWPTSLPPTGTVFPNVYKALHVCLVYC